MAPFKKLSKSVETALATAVIDTKRAVKVVQKAFAPRPKPKPAPEPEAEPAPVNIAPPTDYEVCMKGYFACIDEKSYMWFCLIHRLLCGYFPPCAQYTCRVVEYACAMSC
jgi:hypothetical protein